MTREEIIQGLYRGDSRAIKEAIKALEQQPFMNKPCISSEVCEHDKNKVLDKIRAKIEKLQTYKMFIGEKTVYVERDDVLAIIDKYKVGSEDAVVAHKNLCDSCVTKHCMFQSGVIRKRCDFYKAGSEDKE